MKRLLFLSVLLLLISLLSCSNSDDSVLGPGANDQRQNHDVNRTSFNALDVPEMATDNDDDGDPWEDHRPDEHGPGEEFPGNNDTTGGDGDKNPYEPHDPTGGE